MNKLVKRSILTVSLLISLLSGCFWVSGGNSAGSNIDQNSRSQPDPTGAWIHLSSKAGDLPQPGESDEQTASLILDINLDGTLDFVIGMRKSAPALVWYQRTATGWEKYPVEQSVLDIEAGGAYADIDGDGDPDIVMGGDASSSMVWWWENPYPDYDQDTSWVRREIKNSGASKHHDQLFGDFDGDGKVELVFWNQGAQSLFWAKLPSNPKVDQPWAYTPIYTWSGDEHEGLAQADIDGDGLLDIVGGGRWFKYQGGTTFVPHIIDDQQRFSRAAAGQLIEGGPPEVVFVVGDGIGRLKWYEWNGSAWIGKDLLGHDVDHGHSLAIADMNGDGNLDIFAAEMRLYGGNEDASMWIFEGNGSGSFLTTVVAKGYGNHESRVGDLDGDGDMDILGKPYNWETPRIDVWLNAQNPGLEEWSRHVIDGERPWTSIFITGGDLNGDELPDIITGGWWYQNPGKTGGPWTRHTIGSPLNNMAVVYDFDGDGDLDILGTAGEGSNPNSTLVWARNDGSGSFTILDNIPPGEGDFLQGTAVGRFSGDQLGVALSWHEDGRGIQMLTVPGDPSQSQWVWSKISPHSQDEALSAGDIDGDGDLDLLLGTQWLRSDGNQGWTLFTLSQSSGMPDRNRLADINGDGKLDAVVGYEAISSPGKLAWYKQGAAAEQTWEEQIIAEPDIIGPMSLDVADLDGDGDLDVVVGEHHPDAPERAALYVFENADGNGTQWVRHIIYVGDEHHDGAQLIDIDGDGDLDIISIGWTHPNVLWYENISAPAHSNEPGVSLPLIIQESPGTTNSQLEEQPESTSPLTSPLADNSGHGASQIEPSSNSFTPGMEVEAPVASGPSGIRTAAVLVALLTVGGAILGTALFLSTKRKMHS